MTANAAKSSGSGNDTYTFALTWGVSGADIKFSYLLHAGPSFSGSSIVPSLTLDFGTVTQNAIVSPLGFSLFNFTSDPSNTDGVNLTSITPPSGTNPFSTNLAAFMNLLGGASNNYDAFFDTSTLGTFDVIYTLSFIDNSDGGIGVGLDTYSLTLEIKGSVEPAPVVTVTAVPEPRSIAIFGLGLICLGLVRRRRA